MDINGILNRPAAPSVSDAIQGAANATGASFEYMLATAQAESGLNPHAASPTSSARGLYQFIDQTWLATLKRSGAGLGYGQYADAIVETAAGRYDVPDPILRRDIMGLRDDPVANAAMAGALTRDNAAKLASRLGRAPSDNELYIAHVLGAAGAARLTALAGTNPSARADAAFPAAADANRSIFYDRQGHARSIADVRDTLIGRFDSARTASASPFDLIKAITSVLAALNPSDASVGPAVAPPDPADALTPTDAVVAGATATAAAATAKQSQAPLFQSLFSDNGAAPAHFVPGVGARRASPPAQPNAASLAAPGAASDAVQEPSAAGVAALFGR